MPMNPEDYRLSMRISPRGKIDSAILRQLLVNRLSDTYKAVLRRSLRELRHGKKLSVYCEECSHWTNVQAFPEEWECPRCETAYRIEFAVYEEIDEPVRGPERDRPDDDHQSTVTA